MPRLHTTTVPFKTLKLSNYFRTNDIRPYIEHGKLVVIDGYGERRYWGTPSVQSHVTVLEDDVVSVTVTGWHKHTTSPVGGTYYFVYSESKGWQRRTANHRVVKSVLELQAT